MRGPQAGPDERGDFMLHIVHLIQRRFPQQSGSIVTLLCGASLAVLLLGIGLLLLH